jgi:uncharacterized protein GlcG (DUF336 family)
VVAAGVLAVTTVWLPATHAVAQSSPQSAALTQQIDPMEPLTLAEARAIIQGAIQRAQSRNQRLAVAVVDDGGSLISQDRMDGSSPSGGKGAMAKAFASAMRRQTTQAMSEQLETRPDIYFGIISMYPGQVYLVGGGQPLRVDGRVVGAVGVSGLPQFEDDEAAEAGIAAWRPMRAGAGR